MDGLLIVLSLHAGKNACNVWLYVIRQPFGILGCYVVNIAVGRLHRPAYTDWNL